MINLSLNRIVSDDDANDNTADFFSQTSFSSVNAHLANTFLMLLCTADPPSATQLFIFDKHVVNPICIQAPEYALSCAGIQVSNQFVLSIGN